MRTLLPAARMTVLLGFLALGGCIYDETVVTSTTGPKARMLRHHEIVPGMQSAPSTRIEIDGRVEPARASCAGSKAPLELRIDEKRTLLAIRCPSDGWRITYLATPKIEIDECSPTFASAAPLDFARVPGFQSVMLALARCNSLGVVAQALHERGEEARLGQLLVDSVAEDVRGDHNEDADDPWATELRKLAPADRKPPLDALASKLRESSPSGAVLERALAFADDIPREAFSSVVQKLVTSSDSEIRSKLLPLALLRDPVVTSQVACRLLAEGSTEVVPLAVLARTGQPCDGIATLLAKSEVMCLVDLSCTNGHCRAKFEPTSEDIDMGLRGKMPHSDVRAAMVMVVASRSLKSLPRGFVRMVERSSYTIERKEKPSCDEAAPGQLCDCDDPPSLCAVAGGKVPDDGGTCTFQFDDARKRARLVARPRQK